MSRTILIKTMLVLLALSHAPPPEVPAEEHGIYPGGFNWENPDQVAVWEDELRFTTGRSRYFRSESIYFAGLLDNGWTFTIAFSAWTYSFFGGQGLIVGLTDAHGRSRWYREEVDRKKVTVAEDRLMVRFPQGFFEDLPEEGPGRYRVSLTLEGFSCDLEIRSSLPPWKPGDGYARLTREGDVYTHFRVPVPLGEVGGTLEVDGRPMTVRGFCYGDLSTLVAPPFRMSSPVSALRVFSRDGRERWFLGGYEAVSHAEYGTRRQPMLLLARGREWVLTSSKFTLIPLDFVRNPQTGYEHPAGFEITVEDQGLRLEGRYALGSLTGLDDILSELPPLLRAVADALIKRPVIFRSVGEFRGTLTRPDGKVEDLRLYGLAEYMIIH